MFLNLKQRILNFIDFFYPPFKKFVPLQTFRYACSGGTNACINLLIFSLTYNYIFNDFKIEIGDILISRYIGAYLVALSVTFPLGFLLNRFIVFQNSNLKASTQLKRYGFITGVNSFLDYLLLHLLIGYFGFNDPLLATLSQAFIIIILSLFSYLAQTYFSFKTVK